MIVRPAARHRSASALIWLLLAAPAGGCGGGHPQSDQQLITQALRSYLRAQAGGDGQAACALLTSAAQSQLIGLVVRQSKGLLMTRPSCEEAVGLVATVAPQKLLGALASARIERVQVSGARASAEVVDGTQFPPQQVSLDKLGRSWKVSGVPGLTS
jgi:hypothetical protein